MKKNLLNLKEPIYIFCKMQGVLSLLSLALTQMKMKKYNGTSETFIIRDKTISFYLFNLSLLRLSVCVRKRK